MTKNKERRPAYRDGVELWTEGDVFTAPGGEVVEVLFASKTGGEKSFFVELPGTPACAHGETVEEAIDSAREKRDGAKPLTDEEKAQYRTENYSFSVALFRRITGACPHGTREWLRQRGLTASATMTLKEFRAAGGGQWADTLADRLGK